MYCAQCGHEENNSNNYCTNCGIQLQVDEYTKSNYQTATNAVNYCLKCGTKHMMNYCGKCGADGVKFTVNRSGVRSAAARPASSTAATSIPSVSPLASQANSILREIPSMEIVEYLMIASLIPLLCTGFSMHMPAALFIVILLISGAVAGSIMQMRFGKQREVVVLNIAIAVAAVVAVPFLRFSGKINVILILINLAAIVFYLIYIYFLAQRLSPDLLDRYTGGFQLPAGLNVFGEECRPDYPALFVVTVNALFISVSMARGNFKILIGYMLFIVCVSLGVFFYRRGDLLRAVSLTAAAIIYNVMCHISGGWKFFILCMLGYSCFAMVKTLYPDALTKSFNHKTAMEALAMGGKLRTDEPGVSLFGGDIFGYLKIFFITLASYICTIIVFAISGALSVSWRYFSFDAWSVFLMLLVACVAFVTLSALPKYLIMKWETQNSIINGKRLVFEGTLPGFVILSVKNGLLTAVTLGFYMLLGFKTVSELRWRYGYTKFENAEEGEVSLFTGEWHQYTIYNLVFALVFFVISMISNLFTSTILSSALSRAGDYRSAFSALFSGGNIFDYYIDIVTQSLGAFFIIFVIFGIINTLVAYFRQYIIIKWEVSNLVFSNTKLQFNGNFGQALGFFLMNAVLSVITLGIYALLGFPYLVITKWKIKNIS